MSQNNIRGTRGREIAKRVLSQSRRSELFPTEQFANLPFNVCELHKTHRSIVSKVLKILKCCIGCHPIMSLRQIEAYLETHKQILKRS